MNVKALVGLAIAAELLVFSQLALAHAVSSGAHTNNFDSAHQSTLLTGNPIAKPGGTMNLDLSSTQANMSAGNLALANALSINVGGRQTAVNASTMLTAAEFLATLQVAAGGVQTLRLSASGNAVGGRFSLPAAFSQSIGNLVIPKGVSELDNAASTPSLSLSGNFVDAGKFIAFTTSPQATSATLSAAILNVQSGGLITSSSRMSLAPIDLNLNAQSNFVNAGIIASSANINISGPNDITFNNTSGTVSAPNGAINFRDASYTGSGNLTLSGGNFLSQSLNLYSGKGSVDMNVGEVTGVVNTYAGSAHLSANTANLQIGTFAVTGDPWLNNAGNIDLSGTIASAVTYLVVTAGGSIYTSVASQSITTSTNGAVVLAAGVTASSPDGNYNITLSNSGLGGNIYLTTGTTIDGNATQNITGINTGNGRLTMIACTGVNGGGHIFVPTNATISTGSGEIDIIGQASSGGDAVTVGTISGGPMIIESGAPGLMPGYTAQINVNDGSLTGNFWQFSTLQSGQVTTGAINIPSAEVSLESLGAVNLTASVTCEIGFIEASNLKLANGVSLFATHQLLSITGANDGSLTITGADHGTETIQVNGYLGSGVLTIGSSGTPALLFTSQTAGGGTTISLGASTGVNLIGSTSVTLDGSETLNNVGASAWTLNAPTVQLKDQSLLDTTTNTSVDLTIQTNTLKLGEPSGVNNSSIHAKNLVIDDTTMASGGLSIIGTNATISPVIRVADLSISATNGIANLSIIGPGLFLIVVNGTTVQATGTATFGTNVQFQVSAGTITAPTVALNDGFTLSSTSGSPSLTIHTNNLNLGDGSNGNKAVISAPTLTIDDNGASTFSTTGLTISAFSGQTESIEATSGQLAISATAAPSSTLLLTSSSGTGATVLFDSATGVLLTANQQITVGQAMSVETSNPTTLTGNWVITAPAVTLKDAATFYVAPMFNSAQALTIHTNNLNLGDNSTGNGIFMAASSLTIDDNGGTVFSTAGLTVTSGNSETEELRAVGGPLSISAGASPSASVLLTSTTSGTGATLEMDSVSALSLSANNTVTLDSHMSFTDAGSSGAWSITAKSVTLNAGASVDTTAGGSVPVTINANGGTFTNNGQVIGNGITISSTTILALGGGNGVSNGVLTAGVLAIMVTADTSLALTNGTNMLLNAGSLTIQTPNVILGAGADVGAVTATLTLNGAALSGIGVQMSGSTPGFSFLAGVTSANLNLDGAAVTVTSTSTLSMPQKMMLQSNQSLSLSAQGNMSLSSLFSSNGSITASTSAGALTQPSNSLVMSVDGNVSMSNTAASGGSISLGANVIITAGSTNASQGNVSITMGSGAATTGTKAPKNVKATIKNGGKIFFGTNNISALPPTNNVTANGRDVNFNTGNQSGTAIQLGGGDTISAASVPALTSLDLTNSSVTNTIKNDQALGVIGGSLTLHGGMVVGGTVTLTPLNIEPNLIAENIPQGVAVTMKGFQSDTPVSVSLSGTNTQVVIDGTEKFVEPPASNAIVNISTAVSGPVFSLGSHGALTSDGTLTLDAGGSVFLNGKASAKTIFSVNTTPDFLGNATITIGGVIGSTTSTVQLSAGGSGSIVQGATTGSVASKTVSLSVDDGGIGTGVTSLATKTPRLTLSGSGTEDVFVHNAAALLLTAPMLGGSLDLTNTGNLTLNDVETTGGSLTISTTATLTVNSAIIISTGDGNILLNSSAKAGKILINTNADVEASSSTPSLGSVTICIGGTNPPHVNQTAPANVTLAGTGNVFFGANSITGKIPTGSMINTVTTSGSGVVTFSTGTAKASAITLNGDVTIEADTIGYFRERGASEQVVDTGDDGVDDGAGLYRLVDAN